MDEGCTRMANTESEKSKKDCKVRVDDEKRLYVFENVWVVDCIAIRIAIFKQNGKISMYTYE